jgi:IS5 family transposase
MKQITAYPMGFEARRKTTRRAQFLLQMHQIVPWAKLCALIEPHCRAGMKNTPAVGVERMMRIYFLKQWFSLSDAAVEEALYDSVAMREFVGLDLVRESVPDQTTIGRFRLLLEHRDLGKQLYAAVSQDLRAAGGEVSMGTLVEASILSARHGIARKDLPRDVRHHPLNIGPSAVAGSSATASAANGWRLTKTGTSEAGPP